MIAATGDVQEERNPQAVAHILMPKDKSTKLRPSSYEIRRLAHTHRLVESIVCRTKHSDGGLTPAPYCPAFSDLEETTIGTNCSEVYQAGPGI